MTLPASTYRLQIRSGFDLNAAAALVPYWRDLGVGWLYLSPLLRSAAGSDHGYDVVDPSMVDPGRGGRSGLERLASAAHAAGIGLLVDIVPNHVGIAVPRENPWWWDVLRRGRESPRAAAFDVDWDAGGGRILLPVLGSEPPAAWDGLVVDPRPAPDAPDGLLRRDGLVLPLAPGSLDGLPDPSGHLAEVLSRQRYELRFWRDESTALNYRRFFAVSALAGVRVEDPDVFEAAHAEVLDWVRSGLVDGLRVDHPDGLADPGGYLARLRELAGVPVWAEKILERGEDLPPWWDAAGTTGYDALASLDRLFVDPAGEEPLDRLDARLRSEDGLAPAPGWADLVHDAKRAVADGILRSEVNRLLRCVPPTASSGAATAEAVLELLACFPTYRSYLPARSQDLREAGACAVARRPDLAEAIDRLLPVLADPAAEAARRFQQTTGPVMAKGVEDGAFYRFNRLGTLTEVGGDPSQFAITVAQFHDDAARRQAHWPDTMTTLSTHDTKRGEDVRARLAVLAELPHLWADTLSRLRAHASTGHAPTDTLLWQAVVGAWPADPGRLHAYAEKAVREAGERTGWLGPDPAFEERVHALVSAAFGPARADLDGFVDAIAPWGWSNGLSAKLLQLAGPGVPDVYQGSELWETSLVDPDNRRAVDFATRARMLRELDAAWPDALPAVDATGAAKLLVVSRALRLRRERPGLFARYRPLEAVGAVAGHAVAFDRGGAVAVATRMPAGLHAAGGWGDTALLLPRADPPRARGVPVWRDVITGRRHPGGAVPLAALLTDYPVALLEPAGPPRGGGA